jgi:hypothetical protein
MGKQSTGDFLVQICELRGAYPKVELSDDVRAQLGEDALFVTLPVARVGARSRNGRTYTREAVQSIVDAVNGKRPEGRWGHLRDDERATRYDPPAIRWLAAMLDDEGVAWAKGIPVTAEAREHFRIAKIAGAQVGTSVYGMGRLEGDRVIAFDLETIDLADPNRVGIPDTAAEPIVTTEMAMAGETDMTITLNDVPAEVRQQILEQAAAESGERLSEMEAQVGTLSEQVQTLSSDLAAARTMISQLLVTYAEARISEQVQIEPVRVLVGKLVGIREQDGARMIDGVASIADVDAAISAVLNDESVKAFNKASVAEMMGPNLNAGGQQPNQQKLLGTVPPY